MNTHPLRFCFPVLGLFLASPSLVAAEVLGSLPLGRDGHPLNLDFETGDLRDWKAEGDAFEGQPVRGDTVHARRSDMASGHTGNFWVGTYEPKGDKVQGVLSSEPFKVTQPWASFLVGGGSRPETCVELVDLATMKPFLTVSGTDREDMRPVIVDLTQHLGKEIFLNLVDHRTDGWGHLNFDDFRLHAVRPKLPGAVTAEELRKKQPPPTDTVAFAGLSPAEAVKAATLPPGFRLHLAAAEPDVRQPIAFCDDDRGRLWVAEGFTYPKRREEGQGLDRVLCLEDTDGDHVFDRRTVVLENLNLVSGLEWGFGGLWIGAAPHLLFVPIKDGDVPAAAGPAQVLLDGWDYLRDTHETLNTFSWGPDGWLYGCHGVFCPSHVGKPGASEQERQWVDAAVWRYHPTKHRFEVFAEGTSNPWGLDFDEHGQAWIEACVIPHLWHMIQGGRYQRQGGEHYTVGPEETARNEASRQKGGRKPVFPYVYEDIKTVADHLHYAGADGPHAGNGRSDGAGGGHAHAGMMAYLGTSWPAEYRGNLFLGNIHGQRLNREIPERQGSGYVGHHGPDFLNFNDTWSQTLNHRLDPDGSVYIIDWYDKNQCHHNNVDGHDRSNGRIYKIVYNNQPKTSVDLARLTDLDLAKLVTSPNEWMSRHARRLIQERAARNGFSPEAVAFLEKGLGSSAPEVEKLRLQWALHLAAPKSLATKQLAETDAGEFTRGWALQLALEDKTPDDALLNTLAKLAATDPSPVVRRYVASGLQRLPVAQRWPALAALLQHTEDASDHNLPLLYWYAAEGGVATDADQALALLKTCRIPKVREFIVRRLAVAGVDSGLMAKLAPLLTESADVQFHLDLLRGWETALRGRRSAPLPAGWAQVEKTLADSPSTEVRTLVRSLSLTYGSTAALDSLRRTVADTRATTAERLAALDSLLAARDAQLPALLRKLLGDASLRAAALRGLGTFDDPATAPAILAVYVGLSPNEKRDALNTLAGRLSHAKLLLAAVTENKVPRTDLTAELVRQLRAFKDPALSRQLDDFWGLVKESAPDQQKTIEKYRAIYTAGGSQPGDASRGRVVFNQLCSQCHHLFDTGGAVGPDITGANRSDVGYLLENILYPNAVIPMDYRIATIALKDGRVLTGIVKERTAQVVVVQTANEKLTLPAAEVSKVEMSETSMMPEGLVSQLNEQQLRDLLFYLSRPGQVPLPVEKK